MDKNIEKITAAEAAVKREDEIKKNVIKGNEENEKSNCY